MSCLFGVAILGSGISGGSAGGIAAGIIFAPLVFAGVMTLKNTRGGKAWLGMYAFRSSVQSAGTGSQEQRQQPGRLGRRAEVQWAIKSAGTTNETAVMHKLQHLDINTLGIIWDRTPSNYENISRVLAAMEIINPDGSATPYKG